MVHFESKKKSGTKFCVGFDFIAMPRNGNALMRRIVSFDGFIDVANFTVIYCMRLVLARFWMQSR